MNAKEAREIVEHVSIDHTCDDDTGELELRRKIGHAEGFLEAVEKFGPIIEALEWYKARDDGQVENYPKGVVIPKAHNALLLYRRDVLGEGHIKIRVDPNMKPGEWRLEKEK